MAGTITFGGNLLQGSSQTAPLLGGGETVDVPFSASVADLGVVSGNLFLGNMAGNSGVIRVTDLLFQSLRPAGAGDVSFTLSVNQDFAYAGPPTVDGAFSLHGSTTLTTAPQSSNGFLAGFLGVVLDPFPFGFAADPQGSFPQVYDFGTAGTLQALPATEVMNLQLSLSLRLSDNALGSGPRFDSTGDGVEFASIGYMASAAPVPEPSSQILLGLGALGLLGYVWRRRWLAMNQAAQLPFSSR
jgi:hypothetical protein